MKRKNQIVTGVTAGLAMILLILDPQTALSGAKEGIELCLYTVIPSLFPFLFLSAIVNRILSGKRVKILHPLQKLCGIPEGAESIFLLGFLGGYPVGAQAIGQAYQNGQLERASARRLLGFCSNAGPAFIFGMVSSLFTTWYPAWAIWIIQILSALITGVLLPGKTQDTCRMDEGSPLSMPQVLEQSIKAMANICGWVVLFRVLIAICSRWFLWLLPQQAQVLFTGILELSNGCVALRAIPSQGKRFVYSACMLSFGGLCVGMQTVSSVKDLGSGMYFPGKLLQGMISFLLADLTQCFLFSGEDRTGISVIPCLCVPGVICMVVFCLRRKKSSRNTEAAVV